MIVVFSRTPAAASDSNSSSMSSPMPASTRACPTAVPLDVEDVLLGQGSEIVHPLRLSGDVLGDVDRPPQVGELLGVFRQRMELTGVGDSVGMLGSP